MAAFLERVIVALVGYSVGLLAAVIFLRSLGQSGFVHDIRFYGIWGLVCALTICVITSNKAIFFKMFPAASLVLAGGYFCQFAFDYMVGQPAIQALDVRLFVTMIFCTGLLALLLEDKRYWN